MAYSSTTDEDWPSSEERKLISLLNASSNSDSDSNSEDTKSTASGPSISVSLSVSSCGHGNGDGDPSSPSSLTPPMEVRVENLSSKGTLSIAMLMGMNFPHDRPGIEEKVLHLISRVYPCAAAHNAGFNRLSDDWRRDFHNYLNNVPIESPLSNGLQAMESVLFQGVFLGGQDRHPVRLGQLISEGHDAGGAFQITRVEKLPIPESILTTQFMDHCRRVAAGLLGLNITGNRLLSWDVIADLFFPRKSKANTKRNVPTMPRNINQSHLGTVKRHAHSVSSQELSGYTILKFKSTSANKKVFFQLREEGEHGV